MINAIMTITSASQYRLTWKRRDGNPATATGVVLPMRATVDAGAGTLNRIARQAAHPAR